MEELNNPLAPGGDGVTAGVSEQMGNWAEGTALAPKENKSIYDEAGHVADLGAAQELAGIEKTQGRDVALAREGELERQAETGLTDVEKANMDILEGLTMKEGQAINQHAFMDIVDAQGRKYRVLHTGGIEVKFPNKVVIFNKDGAFAVDYALRGEARDAELKFIDWDKLGDELNNIIKSSPEFNREHLNLPVRSGEVRNTISSSIDRFDFSVPGDVTSLAEGIKMSEGIGVKMAREAEKAKIDPQAVLNNLV